MNILMNRLDNLCIDNRSYELIPESIKKEINMDGMIVGANGRYQLWKMSLKVLKNTSMSNME